MQQYESPIVNGNLQVADLKNLCNSVAFQRFCDLVDGALCKCNAPLTHHMAYSFSHATFTIHKQQQASAAFDVRSIQMAVRLQRTLRNMECKLIHLVHVSL